MRGLLSLVVVLVLTVCAGTGPALAGKGSSSAPPYEEIQAAVYEILARDERMPLPLERIRDALMAHYIRDEGTIYWVGTGRMTPFLQRLADAESDGLNPADYPVDGLIALRNSIEPGDAFAAAQAELYFSAFFVAYAADLKIGRLTPQKVDPHQFRNRKTIDVLRVLTDLKTQRDPTAFLNSSSRRTRITSRSSACWGSISPWPSRMSGRTSRRAKTSSRGAAIRAFPRSARS